jgi:pimeloyl-ACP methyl ester carboxylesterase
MPTANVNGVELYYEMRGTGDCVVLTHGSWTDATGWTQAADRLSETYRVVVWDRRGHSRSRPGVHPGSRAEDADDLAGLIEHVAGRPVHVVGNSYGGNVTLTLVTTRPDLVVSAVVHEPPVWDLLTHHTDTHVIEALASATTELGIVGTVITDGEHRAAAQHFIEHVALGPGSWPALPEAVRSVMQANAETYLDELTDPTALAVDTTALASTHVPLLLTHGTTSPSLFRAVIAELDRLVPHARVALLQGAGHLPHATHTDDWIAHLVAFHRMADCRPPL